MGSQQLPPEKQTEQARGQLNTPVAKVSGLLKSSAVVGVMTMLSRILGLVRDVVIAAFIGANANADAFFVAFKIPQFMRRLFAEGAFSQAFVPVLSEYHTQRDVGEVRHLLDRVAGVLGSSLIFVSGLAVVGAPVLTAIFAPGFIDQPYKYQLTSEMIRITFPYLFFISMAGFAGAVLNTYGRFAVPAFTPVLLNLCLIVAAVWASQYFAEPVMALAWGVFVAGCVQFGFQLPFLYRLGLMPRPKLDVKDDGVVRILKLMVPALFGVSVSQINLLLDTVLASFLPTGSVSWLYYSDRLAELPLGVFGIAVATVILPSLSRKHAADSPDAYSSTMNWALKTVLLISLPASAALILLAEPILLTLFQRGALQVSDITMSSYSLMAYASGLTAFMLIKVLAPGYFARQDTKTPVRIGIIAMVSNMVLNIVFVLPLHHYWQIGHVGLALATTVSAYLNAWLLYRGLHKNEVLQLDHGFWVVIFKYLTALLAMSALLLSLNPDMTQWVAWTWWSRLGATLGLCVAGAASYFALLLLLGIRPRQYRHA